MDYEGSFASFQNNNKKNQSPSYAKIHQDLKELELFSKPGRN